jgi:hypothetical protein
MFHYYFTLHTFKKNPHVIKTVFILAFISELYMAEITVVHWHQTMTLSLLFYICNLEAKSLHWFI